jgi:ankyrin repeat protein/tetratricopeptide (TPR) repeat protein
VRKEQGSRGRVDQRWKSGDCELLSLAWSSRSAAPGSHQRLTEEALRLSYSVTKLTHPIPLWRTIETSRWIMAEAVIGLVGLASSIVTFLDISAKIVALIHECKASASADRFRDIEVQLPLLCETFKGLQDDIQSQKINPPTADALKHATEGCIRQARVIEDLIKRMAVDPTESKVKHVLGAVKRVQTDKKFTDAWRILETYKTTMTMYLARANQLAKAPAPTPSSPGLLSFNVPTTSVANFIGREKILENLKRTLYHSSASHDRAAVLHGMGGQGKTQTALEFCRRATLDGAFECVYWIDCSTNESILLDFESLARKMTSGKAQFPDADAAVQYVKESLSKATPPWLLVFDNLDVPDVFQNIKAYVPRAPTSGSILYISRHADTSRLGTPLYVEGMTEQEAVQLLLGHSQTDMTGENTIHAKNIVKELGFFPLAMDQAASYIHSRRLPLADFITNYSKRKAEILRHTPRLWEYKRGSLKDSSVATNAFTTWELSMALLLEEPDGQDVARLLTLSAFFDNQSLHSDIFRACVHLEESFPQWVGCMCTDGAWDEYKFQDIIANLLSLSLIQSMDLSSGGVSFTLHPLVRDWIQHRLSEKEYNQYAHEAVDALGVAVEQVNLDYITMAARRRVVANVDACISNAQRILSLDEYTNCENFLVSLGWLAHCYVESGRYTAGKVFYKVVLDLRLSRPRPPDDLEHTSTAMNLASVYNYLGLNDQAKSLYESVVKERETHLGRDHEATQRALHGLATTEFHLQNYPQATKIFESLLKTQASQFPERREDFVKAVGQLANAYRSTKRFQLAQTCFEITLVEWVKMLGPCHPTTLIALEGLAIIYRNLNRVDEATKLYAQIMSSHETTFGWEHPRTLRLATNYGIALIHQKKYDEAIQLLETATGGFETLLGPNHPDTLWSKQHLSDGKLVRDQKFNQDLLHYGLQAAFSRNHSEMKRRATKGKIGDEGGQGHSADGGHKGDASKASQPTFEEVWRKVDLPSNPQPGWSELNAVFDASGARDIQAAAVCKETYWGRSGRREGPGGAAIAELLRNAMQYTYADLLDTLEQHYGLGPNEPDKSGWTPLHRAAHAGDLDSVKTLLARRDIDADKPADSWGGTPLMSACAAGHEAVVAALLTHHPPVDPAARDAFQRSVLMRAVDKHSGSNPSAHDADTFPVVKLLLATGRVDINFAKPDTPSYDPDTALAAAAGRGDLESVKLLLDAGARDANRTEGEGRETALLRALRRKQGAIARLLIERAGSDVRATAERGLTSLHLVRDAETCRLLLQLGAGDGGRINAVASEQGLTALHLASDGGVARTLLEAGADAGIRDVEGKTALLCAVKAWKSEVVEVLLGFGKGEVDVPAADGETPLGLAFARGDEEMVHTLLEAGARVDLEVLKRVQMSQYARSRRSNEEMLEVVRQLMGKGR